jgi:hypothetical protein
MRSVKLSWLPVAALLFLFAACTKDDQSQTTSLTVRLIDDNGNSLSGVSVHLYVSSYDMELQQNQARDTQVSDSTGEVSYSGLEAARYYWFSEKGCLNNMNGINTTTGKLVLNQNKVVTSTLTETGSLNLKNTSASQYDVFLDGSLLLTAEGLYECTYKYIKAGTYTIMVSQVGGSATKSYKGTITCGSTLTISYP